MPRLLASGTDSRTEIIRCLMAQHSQTEDDLMEATGFSRTTVRNTLQLLMDTELARRKRRKRNDGRRGPGPMEYWLTTQLATARSFEAELRSRAEKLDEGEGNGAGGPGGVPAARASQLAPAAAVEKGVGEEVFVIVKAGTNDALLTKDGRMLRVEKEALEEVVLHYRKVLRGVNLQPMTLDQYYGKFYPELSGKNGDRPVF